MAQIIIDIPDAKIPLIIDWVDSRTNAGIVNNWTNAEYAAYVDSVVTSWLRGQVMKFQQNQYLLDTFVFDDPTA